MKTNTQSKIVSQSKDSSVRFIETKPVHSKKKDPDWVRINHGWYRLSKRKSWPYSVEKRYVDKTPKKVKKPKKLSLLARLLNFLNILRGGERS